MKFLFLYICIVVAIHNANKFIRTLCNSNTCDECNKLGECIKCKEGYYLEEFQCGIKNCSKISNCDICLEDQIKCIKCKTLCILRKGKCNCTEKPVLIGISCFVVIIVVSAVIFSLSKKGLAFTQKFKMKMIHERNNQNNRVIGTLENKVMIYDETSKIERIYELNKVVVGKGNKDKMCSLCNSNVANVKLDCGCYLCFEDAKNIIKNNNRKYCDKCEKEINNEIIITCGICFQNKNELSKFSCCCALWVCHECFINCKKENDNCPACREKI